MESPEDSWVSAPRCLSNALTSCSSASRILCLVPSVSSKQVSKSGVSESPSSVKSLGFAFGLSLASICLSNAAHLAFSNSLSCFDLVNAQTVVCWTTFPVLLRMWWHISDPTSVKGPSHRPRTSLVPGKDGMASRHFTQLCHSCLTSLQMSGVLPLTRVSGVSPPSACKSSAVLKRMSPCNSGQQSHGRMGDPSLPCFVSWLSSIHGFHLLHHFGMGCRARTLCSEL
jgi:hypothetical protein